MFDLKKSRVQFGMFERSETYLFTELMLTSNCVNMTKANVC